MRLYIMAYFAFLLVVICFACVDYNFSLKHKKYLTNAIGIVLLIIFSIMVSFRPSEINDTANYIELFQNSAEYISEIKHINLWTKYHGVECGYLLLNAFFYRLVPDYHLFFFMVALFSSFFSINGIEKIRKIEFQSCSNHWVMTMAIYFISYAFGYLGVTVRAGLAITFMVLVYSCFCQKKYISTIFFLFIGFTIQRTIICVIIFMIIKAFKLNLTKKYFMLIYALLLGMLLLNIGGIVYSYIVPTALYFFQKLGISGYTAYFTVGVDSQVGLTDIWVCAAGFILCWIYNNKKKKSYDTLYFSFLISSMIIVFLHSARAIARLYDIFLVFSIPIYVEALFMLKKKFGTWILLFMLLGNFLISIKMIL